MVSLSTFIPEISARQMNIFEKFRSVFADWNSRINLVSRKDMEHFMERHVLHSLGITRFFTFPPGSRIIDVGTGGGFPGIPLAIMNPECHFILNDSIAKKIKAVESMVNELGLANCTVLHGRSENIREKFNYICSRAVTSFPGFVKQTSHLIEKPSQLVREPGIIYLKGGDFEEELSGFRENVRIMSVHDHFKTEYFLTKKIIFLPFQ